jgi:hypothetical protein
MMTTGNDGSDRPVGHSAGEPKPDFRLAPAFGGRPGDEKLTTKAAAERAGVKPKTWSSYVRRGYAPQPDDGYDRRTPWWWASTIDEWKKGRKGQGARTDLRNETPKGNT